RLRRRAPPPYPSRELHRIDVVPPAPFVGVDRVYELHDRERLGARAVADGGAHSGSREIIDLVLRRGMSRYVKIGDRRRDDHSERVPAAETKSYSSLVLATCHRPWSDRS